MSCLFGIGLNNMANVWFTSDLHFGHNNIHKFRLEVSNEEENRSRIISDWSRLVTKRDDVYVLGDAAFTLDTLYELSKLPGRKFLVRGNHDEFGTETYVQFFDEVYGIKRYKEFWLTHAPIHPEELRGRVNLHGHVHYADIKDSRYYNMSVESLWKRGHSSLVSLDQVRKEVNELGL